MVARGESEVSRMADLISRQAAIDAILNITNCKSVRELFEYNQLHHLTEMWSGGVNDAIDAVIGVDSAQLGTNLAEVGTDTISRQAAIDALEELTANGTNKGMVFGEDAVHRIEMLPPAQPDCAKCKSELANKIRGQQDNPGMLTENDKGRNWGLEWAAQIVEGKRR